HQHGDENPKETSNYGMMMMITIIIMKVHIGERWQHKEKGWTDSEIDADVYEKLELHLTTLICVYVFLHALYIILDLQTYLIT
ncbi:hypothetical protein ACJX0J_026073, partial [Zea mays]